MKQLLFIVSILLFNFTLKAQNYTPEANEVRGKIIMSDGKELVGYIKLNGSEMSPWNNQKSVEFFTEEATKDGKVKRKEREKYKPKDIKAYVAGDRYFESMKISEAKLDIGVGIATWKFVERIVEGNVNYYHIYETPEFVSVTTTEEERIQQEQELERMRNNPMMVLIKGSEEPILAGKVDLGEFLSECPDVQEKYNNGDYGVEPFSKNRETKVGKWIGNAADAEAMRAVLPEILTDYNDCVQ